MVYLIHIIIYFIFYLKKVAAGHIDADAIIHFGHACMSKITRLPLLYVFYNFKINKEALLNSITKAYPNRNTEICVFYNTGYYYQLGKMFIFLYIVYVNLFFPLDSIKQTLIEYTNIYYGELAINEEADFLGWLKPDVNLENCVIVYLGADDQSFFNLSITLKGKCKFIMKCFLYSFFY